MIQTVEAVIDSMGRVKLLEPLAIPVPRRALVTILEEPALRPHETALLAQSALDDWNRPEEEEAWSFLQPVP